MPRALLLSLALLAACSDSHSAQEQQGLPGSPCHRQTFAAARFTVCPAYGHDIELRTGLRSFASLQRALGDRASDVAFAMNAGMFDDHGRAIGLMIVDGKQLHRINLNKGGGNFHLLPNGVFLVRSDGKAQVVSSPAFESSPSIRYATQSGPMLVIDSKLHPRFEIDGESRLIRNGVGIAPDGTALFVISEDPVSFGKFARFFRDELKARNALFLDGSVSSLWDPGNHRMDAGTELGPMVVAFKPAASKPGRAARATP